MNITKWAFGTAPLKKETHLKNIGAIENVSKFLDNLDVPTDGLLMSISWVKEMFSRIIRQDQWDWMTIAVYMNYPCRMECRRIVGALCNLKSSIKKDDKTAIQKAREQLNNSGIVHRFKFYKTYNPSKGRNGQYIYILSRREEPDVLKIGMTTRDVLIRLKEINSSTGMLFPLGARNVFAVTDAATAEKSVHRLLKDFRIREDREFFKISFKTACEQIEKHLLDEGLMV